ncbi:MAG: DUF2384 domain-containing protein [Deltaproteobacteria bacterium]|nr:DUF2384 domain-containing protein [Deltaproteobacteria bacterium]
MLQALAKSKTDPQLAGPALKAFFNIVEKAWNLSTLEQKKLLGISADSTFYKFKKEKNGTLSEDTLERISYIFGIYKDLHLLLPNAEAADAWIKKPNNATIFGGRSALQRMLSGRVADLYVVRQYLDAQRG